MKNWGTIIFYVRQNTPPPHVRHQNFEFTGTDILRGYELVLSERIMGNGVSRLGVTDRRGGAPPPRFSRPQKQ